MLFTGFSIDGNVLDDTTLCRFRNRLVEKGSTEKILSEVNTQLESYGLKVKNCNEAIIDASVIESASRLRRTIKISCAEVSFCEKWYFHMQETAFYIYGAGCWV